MSAATTAAHRNSHQLVLQVSTIAAILVAAVAHIPVIAPHLDEAPYMGVLFIALTAVCLTLGALIAATDATWAYQSSAAVCGAAVLAYAATRLVAFPQLADDVGNWFEPLGVVSVLSESLVVVLALAVVSRRRATR